MPMENDSMFMKLEDYLCECHLPVTCVTSDLVGRIRDPNTLEKTVDDFHLGSYGDYLQNMYVQYTLIQTLNV